MSIDNIINSTFNINALISPFVARNAPIGPGKVHGTEATTLFTSPSSVAIHAITAQIIGLSTKGIKSTGFRIIGQPKIIGSLMLNNAGTNATLPSVLPYCDLDLKSSKIASPIVVPEPPM